MAGDGKLNLQVSSISRIAPARRVANGSESPSVATARAVGNAPASVPVTRLTSLAKELGEQGPPVDHARIAMLRDAIASGAYTVDATLIANAAVRFHQGSSN